MAKGQIRTPAQIQADGARRRARKIEIKAGTYVPRAQRGPTTKPHYIPEGHELGGDVAHVTLRQQGGGSEGALAGVAHSGIVSEVRQGDQ